MLEQNTTSNQVNNSSLVETSALRHKLSKIDYSTEFFYDFFKSFKEVLEWNDDNYLIHQVELLETCYYQSNGEIAEKVLKGILLSNSKLKRFIASIDRIWNELLKELVSDENSKTIKVDSECDNLVELSQIIVGFIYPGIGIDHLMGSKYLIVESMSLLVENDAHDAIYFNLEFVAFLIQLESFCTEINKGPGNS